ncbi:hypothetical protein [Parasitella parasitica]|uniref:Retrotransposon gag domain-containing protein n=1 Tax=Parasitella parasitica TaxID=35722 RepID=A0A0B7NPA1_9FUNG|nr:hypothetical protein [Parasitella parasitica]
MSGSVVGSVAGSVAGSGGVQNKDTVAGIPLVLEDFVLKSPGKTLKDAPSQECDFLEEDELMAELGGDVTAWSFTEASEEASLEPTASTAKDRHEAFQEIAGNREAIVELGRYGNVLKPKRNETGPGVASSAIKAFPNEEVFESVDHYLRTFESIINSSSLDLQAQWAKLCGSWWEAKQVFARRFGSAVVTRRNTDLVFTMTMRSSDSIADYSSRFQQAVYNAGLQLDDPRVADRFMASLILPVQTAVLARDILGDDNRLYAHAMALLPVGAGVEFADEGNQERRGYSGTSRGFATRNRRMQGGGKCQEGSGTHKKYYCEQHGANETHASKDCQFLKFKRAKAEGKCVACGKPYERGHAKVCEQRSPPGDGPSATALNQEVFATKVVPEGGHKSLEANQSDDEVVSLDADQDQLMSELAFRCKLPNADAKKAETNFFALLTPMLIYVESRCVKVIGKGKHLEADNSPAGTPAERKEFEEFIQESLKRNEAIPIVSHCPLPEVVVRLPTKEGATAHLRLYPIAESLKPVVEKQIQKWLDTNAMKWHLFRAYFH